MNLSLWNQTWYDDDSPSENKPRLDPVHLSEYSDHFIYFILFLAWIEYINLLLDFLSPILDLHFAVSKELAVLILFLLCN